MGRPAKPSYADGLEHGQQAALAFLSFAIDLYPRVPSEATARLFVGLSEPVQLEINAALARFDIQLASSRRKRKNDPDAIGPLSAAVSAEVDNA